MYGKFIDDTVQPGTEPFYIVRGRGGRWCLVRQAEILTRWIHRLASVQHIVRAHVLRLCTSLALFLKFRSQLFADAAECA